MKWCVALTATRESQFLINHLYLFRSHHRQRHSSSIYARIRWVGIREASRKTRELRVVSWTKCNMGILHCVSWVYGGVYVFLMTKLSDQASFSSQIICLKRQSLVLEFYEQYHHRGTRERLPLRICMGPLYSSSRHTLLPPISL